MKTQFNLDIVIDVLSKHHLSANSETLFDPLNLDAFKKCIYEIIKRHDQTIKIDPFIFQTVPASTNYRDFNFIVDNYRSISTHNDITKLSCNTLYGSIIAHLIKTNSIRFNIIEFGELYVYLLENRKIIKQMTIDNKISDLVNYNLRFILNATYGLLSSKHRRFLYSDMQTNLITDFVIKNIVNKLNFTNCIAASTDEFYFDLHSDIYRQVFELACEDFTTKYGLSFDIENIDINFSDIPRFRHILRNCS